MADPEGGDERRTTPSPAPLIAADAIQQALRQQTAPRETFEERIVRERADWIASSLVALGVGADTVYVCRLCGAMLPHHMVQDFDPIYTHFRFHTELRTMRGVLENGVR